MKKQFIISFLLLSFILVPFFVNAQAITADNEIGVTAELAQFVTRLAFIISFLTFFVSGLALIFFIYGLGKFILSAGEEEKRKEGKKFMTWGIVALFVMTAIWGIVTLLRVSILGDGEANTTSMPPPIIDHPFFGEVN